MSVVSNVLSSLILGFVVFALARWAGIDWALGAIAYLCVVNLGWIINREKP